MHAGGEEGEPDDDGQRGVHRPASAAQIPSEVDACQADGGDDQREGVEVGRVDEGDDGQRTDVVDDGEGQEEDPEPTGYPRSDEGERTHEEGGVGGDDHAPGGGVTGWRGDQDEQQGRDRQARKGGEHRHHRARPAGELADGELTPHLESDREEEDRHEGVVDERVERELEVQITQADAEMCLPEGRVRSRGVGPDDRGEGGQQQQQGADAVLAHGTDLRGDGGLGGRAVCAAGSCRDRHFGHAVSFDVRLRLRLRIGGEQSPRVGMDELRRMSGPARGDPTRALGCWPSPAEGEP